MDSLNNIIEFRTKKEIEMGKHTQTNTQEDMISYPTNHEIMVMNAMVEQYAEANPDTPLPIGMWNGDCYKTVFDEMTAYAKGIDADPWDVFGLFINKLHGWRMEEDDDGGITVRFGKD